MVCKARLTYLETLLIQVEGVVNSRPLKYQHEDDGSESLTPYHLLTDHAKDCRTNMATPSVSIDRNPEFLSKISKYLSKTVNSLWKRYKNLYLALLRTPYASS